MTGESEKQGICALCGPDIPGTRILRLSHFLPKAIYKYLDRFKAEGTRLLIRTEKDDKVFSIGPQPMQYLLCDDCEGLMALKGENYYLSQMLKIDVNAKTQSPVYQILLFSLVPLWDTLNKRFPGSILSVGSNPLSSISSQQLYHFSIGMFWKATFDGWRYCPSMPLNASVVEQMRSYLRGGEFLPDHVVRVVPSFWRSKFGVVFPSLVQDQPFFSIQSFDFYLEKSRSKFSNAVSGGGVPLLYTVDPGRSELAYQGAVASYKRAQQAKTAQGTQLTWLGD